MLGYIVRLIWLLEERDNMGCWNKTCGLSNLHINYNQPVYVYILEENTARDSWCYSTCLYRPLLLPFISYYNDYGSGEKSQGPFLDLIMNGLKNNLVEIEQGANPYHDIAVKRDNWSEKLFWDAERQERLLVNTRLGNTPVKAVMFRKDVVDEILEKHSQYDYCEKRHYYLKDFLAEVPAAIARAQKQLQEDLLGLCRFERLFPYGETILDRLIPVSTIDHSRIVNIEHEFYKFLEVSNTSQASLLLEEYIKALYVDRFILQTRRLWVPGGHEGSQNCETHAHKLLANTILRVIEDQEREYGDNFE